ncbi:MAG: zinc dependent phospholipase C family protein [Bacteroidia bacterium]
MRTSYFILFTGLSLCIASSLYSWGFWAHKKANQVAVFTLPYEMLPFYKSWVNYVSEHAVDADKRRFVSESEAPRHYIDLDHYGTFPFDSFPHKYDSAVAKYSADTLNAYGIVPWIIHWSYYSLVKAFKENDQKRILRISADLGHYVADAHVPLHTTENYNGQLTGQVGIHGLWESRLPELFGDNYDYFAGKARYIEDPLEAAWGAVLESHRALDSVLGFERQLNEEFPPDQKYSFEQRGARIIKVYSREYSEAYHKRLDGMVERRLRKAIVAIGSYWYTAWVDAGQPDLNELSNPDYEPEVDPKFEEDSLHDHDGRWLGRPE